MVWVVETDVSGAAGKGKHHASPHPSGVQPAKAHTTLPPILQGCSRQRRKPPFPPSFTVLQTLQKTLLP